jgi:hypothetical protein
MPGILPQDDSHPHDLTAAAPRSESVAESLDEPFVDRRHGPGQRVTDIEHQFVESALAVAKHGPKVAAVWAGIGGAVGAIATFLLMVLGLRIGGAADLSSLRTDVLRRDSAARADALRRDTSIERWRVHTDSVTTGNALRIARLENEDQFKMFLICNIAEQVGARTGGLCPVPIPPRVKP